MKKVSPLLFIIGIVLAASACKNDKKFTLQAELSGFPDDPILVVYDDPAAKLDTIVPEGGKFSYSFIPDTLTLFRLISPEGEAIPVFADCSQKVSLKGTFSQPLIEGDGENGEYGTLLKNLHQIKDSTAVIQAVELFIQEHPSSFASAYLINQYFIQTPSPDLEHIDKLVAPLSGNVKDSYILEAALKSLPSQTESRQERNESFINYFSCKDRNGKNIPWSGNKGSYILLNFWASWDQGSIAKRDTLAKLIEKLPKGKFKVLNISLDYEKDKWLKACKEDSEQWIETCDFKGWKNTVVRQNQINMLPANILISNNRKVLARQLYDEPLYAKVKQLIEE